METQCAIPMTGLRLAANALQLACGNQSTVWAACCLKMFDNSISAGVGPACSRPAYLPVYNVSLVPVHRGVQQVTIMTQ